MSLRAGFVIALIAVSPALAFDTGKLGQEGSLPLSDIMPLIDKYPQLKDEVTGALAAGNKTPDTALCDGMRFPGSWTNLGGGRVAPTPATSAGSGCRSMPPFASPAQKVGCSKPSIQRR